MTDAAPAAEKRTGQTRTFHATVGILILVATAIWWMGPVLLQDGWPMNHEGLVIFERVEGLRRAFSHGDWYPFWAPSLENGYGSPFPLFYPRLFSSVAALLAIPLGSVLVSVKCAVLLFLIAGGLGMRRLLRVSGASGPWSLAGAVLFVLAPYTLTDWFVRGATAEFSAFMILPWLYAGLCDFVQQRRRWIFLAVLLVLLFHAHPMICEFFLVSAGLFLLLTLTSSRRRLVWAGVGGEWPGIVGASVIVVLGVLPQALVSATLMHSFNTDVLRAGVPGIPVTIAENYRPLAQYFADSSFEWGRQWRGSSVEVNRYVCIAIIILMALPGARPFWRSALRTPLLGFLLIWTICCLVLQHPIAHPFFNLLPKANFLQFAWRLLAFITIGQLFLCIAAARAAAGGQPWERAVAVVCVTLAAVLTATHFAAGRIMQDNRIPPEVIAADLQTLNGSLSYGEYLPKGTDRSTDLPAREFLTTEGCRNEVHVEEQLESGAFRATAEEPAPCTISLRQFQTPILVTQLENAHLSSTELSREIRIELGAGRSSVLLRPRTFRELTGWVLFHRP
jgi:hypothetical protein